jgi:hypothetical protein
VALGPKGHLKPRFVPPGMTGFGAVGMALIMTPIEIIGKLVKPFALCLRLFANMTAGHFVILALLGLIFVFATAGPAIVTGVTLGAVAFTLFMMLLELLVAFLQAYISHSYVGVHRDDVRALTDDSLSPQNHMVNMLLLLRIPRRWRCQEHERAARRGYRHGLAAIGVGSVSADRRPGGRGDRAAAGLAISGAP